MALGPDFDEILEDLELLHNARLVLAYTHARRTYLTDPGLWIRARVLTKARILIRSEYLDQTAGGTESKIERKFARIDVPKAE